MLHNIRKIVSVCAGSLLMLTVNLWLLDSVSAQLNRTDLIRLDESVSAVVMPAQTIIEISSTVHLTGTKRLGMNLGAHFEPGGSYLLKNVIRNPGFEAGEYGMIFPCPGWGYPFACAGKLGPEWLGSATTRWFLDGAAYEVVSGTVTVRTGTIISFSHEESSDTFYLDSDGAAPAAGNVLMVRRQVPGYCCVEVSAQPFHIADPGRVRPGSPGVQSLRLITRTQAALPSWRYLVDAYGQNLDHNAGKLLIADGDWHFEFGRLRKTLAIHCVSVFAAQERLTSSLKRSP